MTNAEKFKTADERKTAFDKYCSRRICNDCPAWNNDDSGNCRFSWLDLEAEKEQILPCPFCGKDVHAYDFDGITYGCTCGYRSQVRTLISEAIAAHNRVARVVMEANKKEVK